jgi:hypothetical protein
VVQASRTVILVQVKDNFRIGMGGKAVPASLQFRSQLHIVEDLPIEYNPEVPVFVADGLAAPGQIDNAEARAAQPGCPVPVEAKLIRTTVAYHTQHLPEDIKLHRTLICQVKNPNNPTHDLWIALP